MLKTAYHFFSDQLYRRKMYSPAGAVAIGLLAVLLSVVTVKLGFVAGPIMIAAVMGMILFVLCLTMPLQGFYVVVFLSFFAFSPQRVTGVDSLPVSTCLEILVYGVYLGWQLNRRGTRSDDTVFYKSASTIGLFLFLLLIMVEIFNPNMGSIPGWFLYFRKYVLFVVIYFTSYKLLDSVVKIRVFIRFWIIMCFVAALYACKQQWLGFFGFEMHWLLSDPVTAVLYYQGGRGGNFLF